MNKEVEIQVMVKNPKNAETKLHKVSQFLDAKKQIDKYFVPKNNNYFQKEPPEEYLRVRHENDNNHLNYSFCHFDKDGGLIYTEEYETKIDNPKIVEKLLLKIGYNIKVTVSKNRKYFKMDNFEIVLDEVEELGNFMEIEAKKDFGGTQKTKKACYYLLKKLDIEYEEGKIQGYPWQIYRKH